MRASISRRLTTLEQAHVPTGRPRIWLTCGSADTEIIGVRAGTVTIPRAKGESLDAFKERALTEADTVLVSAIYRNADDVKFLV